MTTTIGMIGLDTSHVPAFTKLLNNPDDPYHVPGGKVIAAFPGGSPDFETSISRVEGFTNQMRDELGVEICDSIEAVAEKVDMIFIESVDGRVHLEQFEKVAKYKKPVYIDKPLTCDYAQAKAIADLAKSAGIPWMSASALRYDDGLVAALKREAPLMGIDVSGPMALLEKLPGYFWYGVHGVEMMVTAMGPGCCALRAGKTENHDTLTCEWPDGRVATLHGLRGCQVKFTARLHFADGTQFVEAGQGRPFYACLLEAIMANLPHGKSGIDTQAMLDIVHIMEKANVSRESGEKLAL